jgi:putative heme-binding domain-containing protein
LESIVEPSKVISDQYGAVDVELQDGGFHSGMVVDESRSALTLITANGERVPLEKSTIASRRPSEVSLMPDGLLDALTLRDLVNLIRFLEEGSEEDK